MVIPALFVGGLFYVTFDRQPEPPSLVVVQGEALGTTWMVKSVEENSTEAEQAIRDIAEGALSEVDVQMSTYRPDSDLMRVNQTQTTESIPIGRELQMVVSEALDIGLASEGAFDVTVGPVVRAWGFGPDDHRTPPEEGIMEALRPSVGQDKIRIRDGTLQKTHEKVDVDLSAIAKGYAVDLVVERLLASGRDNLMAEVGGEIVARGVNSQGQHWRLGIEKPSADGREVHEVVVLRNQAMATSGDYRNYYEVDGERVSHLIDPRTLRPIAHRLASVTVVADRCSTADGWATALSVLGETEGVEVANEQGIAALFIVREPGGSFATQRSTAFDALK